MTARLSLKREKARGHSLWLRAIALALRGPRPQKTAPSERVLHCKLQYAWVVRSPDLPEELVVLGDAGIRRPEAVRHVVGLRTNLNPLLLLKLEGPRQS